MKPLTKIIAALLLTLCAPALRAQMAGSYTIGGSNPDYATIDDAVNALMAQGVQSPCTFFVRPGTYVGLLTFPQLNYSYEVEFRSETGNPDDVQLKMSNLYQCRNITFSNMTIVPRRNTNYTYNYKGLEIAGSSFIKYDSCVFRGTTDPLERWGPTLIMDWGDVYFTYCSFRNLDNGITFSDNTSFQGSSRHYGAHVIQHCDFDSVQIGIFISGEFHGIDDSLQVADNYMHNVDVGIKIWGVNDNVRNVKFLRNTIIANNMGVHSYHNNLVGTYRIPVFINNMITAPTCVWSQENKCIAFYNNSFYGQISLSWTSSDFWFYNNTIQYMGTATVLAMDDVYTWHAGNNNYYSPNSTGGMFYVANASPSSINDLSTFCSVTQEDTGSLNVDPMYYSQTDLHSYSPYLKFHGRPFSIVQNDIDGELRNPVPDIGADEYHASLLPPHAFFEIACSSTNNYEATLLDTSVRATGFSWNFGDLGTSTLESPAHTWAGPGPYTITQIVTNSFGADTTTRVMQFPATVPIVTVNGTLMTVTNGPYTAFQWYFNGSPVGNATAASFNAPFNGIYSVVVWDATCTCPYISAPIAVSVEEYAQLSMLIAPNPTGSVVNVTTASTGESLLYEVYDAAGRLLNSFTGNASVQQIDLSRYENGSYFLRITNERTKQSAVQLMIKQ